MQKVLISDGIQKKIVSRNIFDATNFDKDSENDYPFVIEGEKRFYYNQFTFL